MVSTRGSKGNRKIDEMLEKTGGERHDLEDGEAQSKGTAGHAKDDRIESDEAANRTKAKKRSEPETTRKEECASSKRSKIEEDDAKLMAKVKPGDEEGDGGEEGVKWKVLERGHIFYFYRPKVQPADGAEAGKATESIDGVQSTHMLLLPKASESPTTPVSVEGQGQDNFQKPSATSGELARRQGVGYRLIRLGKKRMPAPEAAVARGLEPGGVGGDSQEAIWACVSDIGPDPGTLSGEMGEKRYSTRTRGDRLVAPSRAVGRGHYLISVSLRDPPSSKQVRLSYALSHPSEAQMGSVQEELGLEQESSVILQMRNPTTTDGSIGLESADRVKMNQGELDQTFGGSAGSQGATNYARPEDLSLLDREGVELLMIRERIQAQHSLKTGAGDSQGKALQTAAKADGKRLSVVDVLEELQLSAEENPPQALEGQWI